MHSTNKTIQYFIAPSKMNRCTVWRKHVSLTPQVPEIYMYPKQIREMTPSKQMGIT